MPKLPPDPCRAPRGRRRALLAALALVASDASAWGPAGHQTVGTLADELLRGTRAQQEVRRVLGGSDLRTAAVWADCAKGVSASSGDRYFSYSNDDNEYTECAVFDGRDWSARFVNYVRANWKQCGLAHDREYCHNQYHYADISTFRGAYAETEVGAKNIDVVHSIAAAVAVLQDKAPPAPFVIPGKLEALMLLTHFVGDIHQPLHVEAIYLDADGHPVDPDPANYQKSTDTSGGNLVYYGSTNFHAYWDSIPDDFVPGAPAYPLLRRDAAAVAPSTGDPMQWSAQWASDTIAVGKAAFQGIAFAPVAGFNPASPHWSATLTDPQYEANARGIKQQQIAKAGARLAQLLRAIWPDQAACNGGAFQLGGYLDASAMPNLGKWQAKRPRPGSRQQLADEAAFLATRDDLRSPRGAVAAADDVWSDDVLPRFAIPLGATLTKDNAPRLYKLVERVEADAGNVVLPLKKPLCAGGAVRPFVAHPVPPSCTSLILKSDGSVDADRVAKWQSDVNRYKLDESGSYPSTHALLGHLVGAILAQAAPGQAALLRERGEDFGESRLVCGFHWPSDLAAGRGAADALLKALEKQKEFRDDLQAATEEVARGLAGH